MHRKGIFSWFGFAIPLEERMELVARLGFDNVLLWWGDEFSELNGPREKQGALARGMGLFVENAHLPYEKANDIWLDNQNGHALFELYRTAILECAAQGIPTVVIHPTDGPCPPPPSAIGLDRFAALDVLAGESGVGIALENLRAPRHLDILLDSIKSPSTGFCYDSGHAFVTGEYDLLQKHGHRLKALHLHDNNGLEDQHLLPGQGRIDWKALMALLRQTGYPGALTLESALPYPDPTGETPETYMKKAMDSLRKLEEL